MNYVVCIVLLIFPLITRAAESTCYGSTANGYLENAVKLPSEGKNFISYSKIAESAGRTYVHSKVSQIIADAYKYLETEQPDKVFKYAETGLITGGPFPPHKTHRNGLSVDFMTPVINSYGQSVHLPTHPRNTFGYAIEFDKNDQYDGLMIDYEALAAHLVALDKTAKAYDLGIWRVIFDPNLQPKLLSTKYGDYIKSHIALSSKPSWVRHDEHYHVDFDIECQKPKL